MLSIKTKIGICCKFIFLTISPLGTPPPTEPPPTRGPTLKPRTFPTEEPHKKGDFHSWPNYNYLGTGRNYCNVNTSLLNAKNRIKLLDVILQFKIFFGNFLSLHRNKRAL